MGAGVVQKSGGGKRRRRGRGRAAAMSEINVTPFVDVMLVLLIIFMVAAPMMNPGVPVELPETAATALPTSEDEEPLTLTLTAEGTLLIMSNEEPFDDLVGKLQAIAAERTDNQIYLRADGAVPYARVAQVMGALNAGGFNKINFVTEQGGPRLDGSEN